ncbi:rab-GTPase-TBC domain-containing protein [Polychytrium aggregatum]|uniref:rab-GTPase-TBC domain-containing protein n=1 Tax=Polychytrium aggregatum TaxID=110093 RepID=UPI0022FE99C8|nr:rab-GTPase-TBC domain-containing protein [Polychytrium aggregatum]KAI9206040.1 rab-GTPase-TBC domain-containing protein [Polychytrium aggregatum]
MSAGFDARQLAANSAMPDMITDDPNAAASSRKTTWFKNSLHLPGKITSTTAPSKGTSSHSGIGLGAGILGASRGAPHLAEPAYSNSKADKSSREFAAFLSATDDEWDSKIEVRKTDPKMVGGGLADMSKNPSHAGSSNALRSSIDNSPKKGSPMTEEESKMLGEIAKLNSMQIRYAKFRTLLEQPNIDLDQLRKLSWMGIPEEIRPTVWKLLMNYLPCNSDRREATLTRKRKEYEESVAQSFGRGKAGLDQSLLHQIHIDVQRTNATIPLYQSTAIQEALERILYCWAIRHPASGYVQGINDLVTPFFQVYLQSYVSGDVEKTDVSKIKPETLTEVEADCFWCLTKLLDGIQDNYTHGQPGIQRQMTRLAELISRIDAPLYNHFQQHEVKFVQFSFRWMNCLLMREISLKNTIRMWDSYQAEGADGFSEFHIYVCAAFLIKWKDQLKKMDFPDIMMFLQNPPTSEWDDKDIELLLSEAFMWKALFHNSPNHLSGTGATNS